MTLTIETLPTVWQELWQELNYQTPTVVQEELYYVLKEGQNVLGVSPTGTGKTVAYLLPLLERITKNEGNQLLILLPTQELAMQITEVARIWCAPLSLNVQPIIGQANMKRQIEKLKEKPEIIVGTPGRVYELVQQKKIKVHMLKTLVLDEIDQLVEHSELNAASNILKRLQKETQLVGISATGQTVIEAFEKLVRREYQLIDVTKAEKAASKAEVLHGYLRTPPRKRGAMLRSLAHVPHMRGIVFFNEVQDLGSVSDKLHFDGVPNATLASDQNKFERQRAIQAFQEKKMPFLLTTDLGARGLDFQDVDYVIHYDVPYEAESYVHRSGRTGRMNRRGTVLTLLSDHQMKDLKKVSQSLSQDLKEVYLYAGKLSLEEPVAERLENAQKEKKHKKKDKSKKVSKKKGTKR